MFRLPLNSHRLTGMGFALKLIVERKKADEAETVSQVVKCFS